MDENVDVINSRKMSVDKTSMINMEVNMLLEKKIRIIQYIKLKIVIM